MKSYINIRCYIKQFFSGTCFHFAKQYSCALSLFSGSLGCVFCSVYPDGSEVSDNKVNPRTASPSLKELASEREPVPKQWGV